MHATASAKPIPIPHNQKTKSMSARTRARGHSVAQTTAVAATKPASPSHRSQSPMMAQHTASTSAPSSAAIFSTSSPSASTRTGPSSTASKLAGNKLSSSSVSSSLAAASGRDLNIREFFPEDDAALLKFMDEASIIKAQREALEALNDAVLARALRESEEMAAKEEMKRMGKGKERASEATTKEKELFRVPIKEEEAVKDKGKGQEKERVETEVVIAKEDVISSTESGAGIPLAGSDGGASPEIKAPKDEISPVPVADTVTKTGEEVLGHQQEAPRSSSPTPGTPPPASSPLNEQSPTSTMTVSPFAPPNVHVFERYSEDEAAARLLAREWKVASLQGALLQNPDMAPPSPTQHQIPVSASSSTSSSSSSVFFSPNLSANASMTSVSSSVSSLSSSASAAARKTAVVAITTASASPTANRVMQMTIPAETFYSRSSRHKRGDSDSSSSSVSSSNTIFSSSRPSTAATSPGPSSQKSSPPTSYIMPTSPTKERPNQPRSGLLYTSASLAAAAQAQAQAQAQAHAQAQAQAAAKSTSVSTSIPESVKARSGPITSTTFTSTSTTAAHNSTVRIHGTSRRVPAETLHKRSSSSSSPERPRTAPSSAVTPTKAQKVHTSTLVSPLSPSKASTTANTLKSNFSVPSSSTNAAGVATSATTANVTVIPKGVASPSTPSHTSAASEKSRSPSVSSSPGISPSTSATSSTSVNSTSTSATSVSTSSSANVTTSPTVSGPVIVTSASKVAAEKEREREKEREKSRVAVITSKLLKSTTPSSSASAAAKRASMSATTTATRPAPTLASTAGTNGDHHSRDGSKMERDRNEVVGLGLQGLSSLSSTSAVLSSATLPSPILRATSGLDPITPFSSPALSSPPPFSSHQRKTSTSTATTASTSASTFAAVKSTSASSSATSTPQRPLSPLTTTAVRPRDAEELFSIPTIAASGVLGGVGSGGLGVGGTSGVVGPQQVGCGVVVKAVVPISMLLESDDEDDDTEEEDADDEEEDEEGSGEEDNGEEEEVDEEVVEVKVTEVVEEVKEEVPFLDVYTADRSCSKCGESIVYSPYNPKKSSSTPSFTLHISCPRCSTLHCRGCASPATKCPRNCTGPGSSTSCDIINECCPQVRAIAIFEALSAFDKAYLAEVNGGRKAGNAQRAEFIKDLISKPVGSQARRLEAMFVRCMNLLVEVFNSSSSSSSKLLSTTLALHFEHSLMPEVIHLYLENTNVKYWITHSDVYTAILDLLRYMFEAGFGEGVMDVKLRRVGESKGLKEWLLVGEETMRWVTRVTGEKVVQGGEMWRGLLKGGAESVVDTSRKGEASSPAVVAEVDDPKEYAATMEPLKSLIMDLEMHRTSLLEVLDKVTFMPVVEKLNVLCDGISQLVLGQVLGI